ncbi:hypothetical protein CLOM_g15128 [Closterium sp. NIES-68]|nr:hypothetical protein CLOM_g15128 [Closterium sp. NIES-68]GJP86079.1 hypothetical protein CLOP_g16140 [Closterium sp. NIES-67]
MACSSLAAASSGLSFASPAVTGLVSPSIARGEVLRSSPPHAVRVAPRGAALVVAAVATSAPVAGGADQQQQRRQLEALPLSQLRAMARARGVSGGGSKADLVSDLLRATERSASSAPQPASAASAQPTSAPQAAVVPAAAPAAEAQGLEKRLQATPLAALRAMARQKGVQGNTKEELVAALIAATPSLPSSAPTRSASTSSPSAYSSASAPAPSNGSAAVFAPARAAAAAAKPNPATLVAEAPVPAPLNIPFQSEFSTPLTPVQAAQLQVELASLREAMAALQADQKVIAADREGLREQAGFLRNLLIGGIGLAAVPLLLPAQIATTAATGGAVAGASAGGVAQTPPPPQEPAPEVRQLSPEDFCSTLPANLLSPQAARFCSAVNQMGL